MHFCFLWDYLPSLKKFPWITAAINLIPFFYTHRAILAICSPNCAQVWKGSDRKTVFLQGET